MRGRSFAECRIPVCEGKAMLKVIEIIGKAAVFICAVWAFSLISVLLHEFGHALAYTLATGDRRWHIEVGQGKKILDTKPLTVKMFVIDGYFSPDEDKIDSTAQDVMTMSGGPIVTLLLVTGLLVLRFGGIHPFSEIFASGMIGALFYAALIINLFILFWSVFPAYGLFRNMDDVGTDVMQIINALKHHRK